MQETQLADALALFEAAQSIAAGREIIVTGQSLGGGLAGLVSAIKGVTAYAFAPAPFQNQLEYEATYAALALEGITREAVAGWSNVNEEGFLYSVEDAISGSTIALNKILQYNTSFDEAQRADIVESRADFLESYTYKAEIHLQIHTIEGEVLSSGLIGAIADIGADEFQDPTVEYVIGDGNAVSKHGSALHNLVIRTEGTPEGFSSLQGSDKALRDALLDRPEISSRQARC